MFKKVLLLAVCASAITGCHTLNKGNYKGHTHPEPAFVNARVEMIQSAPEVCTALLTESGASTGAVVAHNHYVEGDKPSYECKENAYEAKITYFHPHTERPVTQWVALDRKVKTSSIRLPVSVIKPHRHKH